MRKLFITLILVLSLFISGAGLADAQQSNTTDITKSRAANTSGCAAGKLCNPLKYDSIEQLIPALLDILAQVGLIICTFFIIFAGFQYVIAQGNPEKIKKAHSILLWAFVGTAVLLGAKVLASILGNTLNQIIK